MAQGETQITIVGNLVEDPSLRFTPAGAAVCNFRIASTPRQFNKQTNQWEDQEALFLTCNAWRNMAENIAESLTKGMRIMVSGRLRQRSFETREGEKRTVMEVEVDEVGPSLRYATAQVQRQGPRQQGGFGGQQSSQQGGFGGEQGGFGGGQGGFGGNSQPNQSNNAGAPDNDPWNAAPPAGGFGGSEDAPPF